MMTAPDLPSVEIDGTTWYINPHGVVLRSVGGHLRFANDEMTERVKQAAGYEPCDCCYPFEEGGA